MQYLVTNQLGSDWVSSFTSETEAIDYASKRVQSMPGQAVGVYKIERVLKTEPLPTNDIKVDTIEGDVVKYLASLKGDNKCSNGLICSEDY